MKRLFDILIAGCALIVFAPVLAIIAFLIRCNLGSPILFRQMRPGRYGKKFTMVKFRTMRDEVDREGNPLQDSKRLTPLGAFLRSSSLDELPELWNVLKGDMSIVGPRPLLVRYSEYFTEEEKLRFRVRPGITGWAQINGRNEADWDSRLARDVWYVKNKNIIIDIKIIFRTIEKVLTREGAVPDANLVMEDLDVYRKRK